MDIEDEWRKRFRIRLETPRFVLRPLMEGDVEWLAAMFMDEEVNRFLWDGASPPDKARKYAEAVVSLDGMRSRFGHWAIQDKDGGAIHGWVELGKLRPYIGPSDCIAISYALRRESWGRGIATEAAGRLLRYAFELHELDCVMAVTGAGNKASRRVLEKLGMRAFKSRRSKDGRGLRFFRIDQPEFVSLKNQLPA